MEFYATFNNISVMSWQSVLLLEETGVSGENHRPVAREDETWMLKNNLLFFVLYFQILLVAIFLTSALIHKLRRPPLMANNDDDVVYEMARSQEKSPYPTRGPYANLYNS